MSTMKVDIPSMKECPNYSHWKNLINVWKSVTSVAKEKQADCILLTLDSDAQSLALQVPDAERKAADGTGVAKVLEKLDTLYEQNLTQKLFTAFEDFENFKREPDMSLAKFISAFEMKSKELADLKVVLPQSLLAFKLLKSANLGDECTRIVRVAVNTNSPTDISKLTLETMKATILNAFDVRLETQGSSSSSMGNQIATPCTQPFDIKSEPLDVYQSRTNSRRDSYNGNGDDRQSYQKRFRGSWRDSNSGKQDRRNSRDHPYNNRVMQKDNETPDGNGYRMNRIDKDTGKPSQCRLCSSVYHWARQCPKYNKQLQDAVFEAQTIDVTLLSHSLENSL